MVTKEDVIEVNLRDSQYEMIWGDNVGAQGFLQCDPTAEAKIAAVSVDPTGKVTAIDCFLGFVVTQQTRHIYLQLRACLCAYRAL